MEGLRTVGRYEIVREIGRGAMATVFVARQLDLERPVALKELRALATLESSASQRFLREARLAGSLSHPNIVTVHDYFEHDGVPYIAMEYHAPGSLRPYVGRLTLAQVARVLEGLLAGLSHAQRHQVVHRDIKPENLLVTEDGGVKIADFGIAKATHTLEQRSLLTAVGTTVGTPNYIAPEQAMARQLGPWTDLYSVGITAFELLVGRTPFGDTGEAMGIVLRQINEPVPWISDLAPSVDPSISDWVSWLVSKSPSDRPQTAGEAWDALEGVLLGLLGPRWRREASLLTAAPQPAATSRPEAGSAPLGLGALADLGVGRQPSDSRLAANPVVSSPSRRRTRPETDPWLAATVMPRRQGQNTTPTAGRRGRRASLLKVAAVAASLVAIMAVAVGANKGRPAPSPSEASSQTSPTAAPGGAGSQTPGAAGSRTPGAAGSAVPQTAGGGADVGLADQVAPARELAKTYDRAASRISGRIQGDPSNAADTALVSALRRTASNYRAAAAAAERGDLAGYTSALTAAAAGRKDVATLIDASSQAGDTAIPAPAPAPSPTPSPAAPEAGSCAGDSSSDDPSDDECGE